MGGLLSQGAGGAGRRVEAGRAACTAPLLDAGLLAGRRVVRCADLRRLEEVVGDDRVLDVVLLDRDRVEQDRRHLTGTVVGLGVDQPRGRLLALGERHGELGRGLRLLLDREVDRHVLLAREDPLDRGHLAVLPGRRDGLGVDAVALHRGDRAAGHAVVGGVDAGDLVLAQGGDRLLHLALRLVRAPVRRVVLLADLHRAAVEDRVGALLVVARARIGRGAVDDDDGLAGALVADRVHERLRLQLADLHVVERHVVADRCAGDEPVVGHDRHAGLLGAVDDADGRLGVDGVEHEHLGAVGDRRLGLLLLAGRILVGVGVVDLAVRAEGLDLGGEQRAVVLLVARGLGLREQEGDLAALAAAAAARGRRGARAVAAAAVVVVAAAGREPGGYGERGRNGGGSRGVPPRASPPVCGDPARPSGARGAGPRRPPAWGKRGPTPP